MASARTLILMRHGKSAYPPGVGDHERPLAPRGEREAALGGEWIRAVLPPVDAVLCSTSTRTRQTLEHTGIGAPVEFAQSLYGAYPEEIVEEVSLLGDAVRTALVVAHFPGIPETALTLASDADNTGAELAQQVADRYPTSAIAVLSVPSRWADLAPGSCLLTHFHIPR